MKKKLIILDRDGVINDDSDDYIKSPEEWRAIPSSLVAIAELNRAGYEVVVVTNQAGIAKKLYTLETLSEIHEKLARELAAVGGYIEEIFVCPHQTSDNCECRKPKIASFLRIAEKYGDLRDVFFIGDKWIDMQAAWAVPCNPILVLSGYGQKTLAEHPELSAIPHFANLAEAVNYVLA